MSDQVQVTRAEPCGMITFRGDLSASAIKKAVKTATGVAIPKPGTMAGNSAGGVLWMSPDELLLMVPNGETQNVIAQLNTSLSEHHILVADVSDARSVFRIDGLQAAQVLARLCPVDLHKDSFGVGDMRRTRLAQVAAAFWRDDMGFEVVCFRSVGDYAYGVLLNAAQGPVVAV